MKLIDRHDYLDKIISVIGTPDIKVITGVRRTSWSYSYQTYSRKYIILQDAYIQSIPLHLRYQHNLHNNPVSKRLTPSRQYLLKLARRISRSIQILLILFSFNISFILKCKLPYSEQYSECLSYGWYKIFGFSVHVEKCGKGCICNV